MKNILLMFLPTVILLGGMIFVLFPALWLYRWKNSGRRSPLSRELLRSPGDAPYVFFDVVTDKPFSGVQGSFITACKRAGIKDFHFHDLRHTFASQLVMNGVDLASVQKLLGHANITMTMRYSHLSGEHLSNAVNVLGNLFQK